MYYDVVIIGGGVAGLTASLYTARAKKSTLVIEENVLGGTTASLEKIENYPACIDISGFQLIQNLFMQVSNLGVNIEYERITKIDFEKNIVYTNTSEINYGALIIASGTSPIKLNIKDEEKYKFKGLSYCAVCDGSLYKDKSVVVVTNGNTAKNSVDYLYNITKNITVLDKKSGYNNSELKVYPNVTGIELSGNNKVEKLSFCDGNNKKVDINCDGIFVDLGKKSNIDLYGCLTQENGFLVTDENMHTNIDNVFVAGDIRKKSLRQIVTACADGAIAGTEAIKFLSKNK